MCINHSPNADDDASEHEYTDQEIDIAQYISTRGILAGNVSFGNDHPL